MKIPEIVVSPYTGVELVRRRPGMYVGSLTDRALVSNLIGHALQEIAFVPGLGVEEPILVTLCSDGSITIVRGGIDVSIELAVAMFGDGWSHMRPVGLLPGGKGDYTNALSEWMRIEFINDGQRFVQVYVCGVAQPLYSESGPQGVCTLSVSFRLDPTIIPDLTLDVARISAVMQKVSEERQRKIVLRDMRVATP